MSAFTRGRRLQAASALVLVVLLSVPAAGAARADGGPPNDFFAFATTVTRLPFIDAAVDTRTASSEPGEVDPTCAHKVAQTVWYRFEAPVTTTVTARLAPRNVVNSSILPVIEVYEGTALDGLTQLSCVSEQWVFNKTVQLPFKVTAGRTYYIQVGGHGRTGGVVDFSLSGPVSSVTLKASASSVRAGTSVVLSGTVRPSRSSGSVTIQRKLNGVWRTFATVRLSSASAYRYTWTPKAAGTYVLRATIGPWASAYVLGGKSVARTIVVR